METELKISSPDSAYAVRISGTTKIVGIFGDPVIYTLSPKMHNFAFNHLHLDFAYLPFLVKPRDLESAVKSIRSLNLAGVNVTIPHKEAILPYLDEVTPLAKTIGAVNTICHRGGRLIGHNTDASGFLTSLREDGFFNPLNKRVLLLGAGGTARAMSVALLESGIQKLTIVNRTPDRAKILELKLGELYPASKKHISCRTLTADVLREELSECDLLLNATPAGLDTPALAVSAEKFLSPQVFVFDAVYAKVTPLLAAALRIGAPHLDGMGMLVRQGALSFSLWTGVEPPVKLMRQALEGKIQSER